MSTPNSRVVKAHYIHHHRELCIGLKHRYDEKIYAQLKHFSATKWSGTNRCFFITTDRSVLKQLHAHLAKSRITLDISALRELPATKPATARVKFSQKQLRDYKPWNSIAQSDDTLDKIRNYTRYMEQLRYAESTIKTYASMVKQFFAFHARTPWNELTENHLVQYNREVFIEQNRSFSTQNQMINAIKLFYSYHKSENIIPDNIERPRKTRKLPNILSKAEVKQIIESTRNIKHRTLLILVYGSGLRIGEALRLKLNDISEHERLMYIVQSKGRKDRRVLLSESQLRALKDYYKAYKPTEYVFEGQHGGQYSYRSAQQVFKRAAQKAGIRRPVTLHTLRHSFATHLLESGVGLRYIQEILGHNSPKTTMIYTHVSGKKISEIRSPLEDLDL